MRGCLCGDHSAVGGHGGVLEESSTHYLYASPSRATRPNPPPTQTITECNTRSSRTQAGTKTYCIKIKKDIIKQGNEKIQQDRNIFLDDNILTNKRSIFYLVTLNPVTLNLSIHTPSHRPAQDIHVDI